MTSKTTDTAKLSILIPTCNEPTLPLVLDALKKQSFPGLVIYILGFGPARQVADLFGCKFMDSGVKTPKSKQLNRAIQQIEASRMIILDADAIPKPGWLAAMLAAFDQGHQVFSASVDIEHGNYWMRVYNFSMLHEFTPDKKPGFRKHLPSISLGFTRAAFQTNGPFREDFTRCDDYEWSLRAFRNGLQPYFNPTAVLIHDAIFKTNLQSVLHYWQFSGYENWQVRQWYADELNTPVWMKSPTLILILAPLLALFPTLRIFKTSPALLLRNLQLLPLIYVTKLAWCWGVYIDSRKEQHRNVSK